MGIIHRLCGIVHKGNSLLFARADMEPHFLWAYPIGFRGLSNITMDNLNDLKHACDGKSAPEIIWWAINTLPLDRLAMATSFGAEDQALIDMLSRLGSGRMRVFTLDTGRLFQETYDVMHQTRARYEIRFDVYGPDPTELADMVRENGPNLFYESVENRKACCGVRKVHPLKKALHGMEAWICGVRRDQSLTRAGLEPVEWDESNGLIKISPLCNWTEDDVWSYIKEHRVPYNILHDQGFRSIGCAPCTRAVRPGEDIRSGRWWWEAPEHKECGLHNRPLLQNK
jgi:phosphoadenosine phosphosulfate reductase